MQRIQKLEIHIGNYRLYMIDHLIQLYEVNSLKFILLFFKVAT